IIVISDSDDDELPSFETVLKNIAKFTRYKKINNVELIEIQDDATAANNNNDDFTYTINNDHFLRISKKTIKSKLKGMVKRLKSKKAIRYIAKICKHKESYNSWILWNERVHANVRTFDENTAVWKPNLGTDINKQEFLREVIIPKLDIMFIMTDLKISDYDTAIIITLNSRITSTKRCIIITGAGISYSGGIPDFSSLGGLYSMIKCKYPSTFHSGKDLFDAQLLRTHNSIKAFNLFMGVLKELIVNAKPTATHYFIKKLADLKKLKRVYTQNLDNLEELVGLHVDWQFEKVKNCKAQVVQLHGTLTNLQCNICTNVYSFTTKYCNSFKQDEAPNCPECEIRGEADCLIIMGTSLRIPGVKALIKNFARAIHGHGGFVIFVNATDVVTKELNGKLIIRLKVPAISWLNLLAQNYQTSKQRDYQKESWPKQTINHK
ncbi:12947_t:CDS:2, partial [Gigaspora margarita]